MTVCTLFKNLAIARAFDFNAPQLYPPRCSKLFWKRDHDQPEEAAKAWLESQIVGPDDPPTLKLF